MQREDVAAGTVSCARVIRDRFYVPLTGIAGVSQQALGERRILRSGEYFGEVALTMKVPGRRP